MKRLYVALTLAVMALMPSLSQAQTLDTSKLTPEQVRQLQAQVEKMQGQPSNISASVRKEAEAWGELGSNMGKAMVSAAREIGVASNEFASTPLGKIVVAIVAYKIVGQDILGLVMGAVTFVFGYSIALFFLLTRRWNDNVKYEVYPVLKGLFHRRRLVDGGETTEGIYIIKFAGAAVVGIATTVLWYNMIF